METFEYQFEKTDDYNVSLELCAGYIFVHCSVINYKPSVHKRIKKLLSDLSDWCYNMGYSDIHAYIANPAFLLSVVPTAQYDMSFEHNGIEYEVYKCHKRRQ